MNTDNTIDNLFDLTATICDLTDGWKPDCTLFLLHTGIGLKYAADTLWQSSFGTNYPNAVLTNIGREKVDLYRPWPKPRTNHWYIPDKEYARNTARYLVWLEQRSEWQAELLTQIREVIGSKNPKRILIADDVSFTGGTAITVVGLLQILFPKCEFIFISGSDDWMWSAFVERLEQDNFKTIKNEREYFSRRDRTRAIYDMMPGTCDINSNSLRYRQIDMFDNQFWPLLADIPAESWGTIPAQFKSLIEQYIGNFSPGYELGTKKYRIPYYKFSDEVMILRKGWLEGKIVYEDLKKAIPVRRLNHALRRLLDWDFIYSFGKLPEQYYLLREDVLNNTHEWEVDALYICNRLIVASINGTFDVHDREAAGMAYRSKTTNEMTLEEDHFLAICSGIGGIGVYDENGATVAANYALSMIPY